MSKFIIASLFASFALTGSVMAQEVPSSDYKVKLGCTAYLFVNSTTLHQKGRIDLDSQKPLMPIDGEFSPNYVFNEKTTMRVGMSVAYATYGKDPSAFAYYGINLNVQSVYLDDYRFNLNAPMPIAISVSKETGNCEASKKDYFYRPTGFENSSLGLSLSQGILCNIESFEFKGKDCSVRN